MPWKPPPDVPMKSMKARIEVFLKNPYFPIIFGLQDGRYTKATENHENFLYADHSYFMRDWRHDNFRLVKNGLHLTRVIPNHQKNRLKRFGVEIKPYRSERGSKIGFLRTSSYVAQLNNLQAKEDEMVETIKASTDREIIFRSKGDNGTLEEFLSQCHAAVSVMTVAAVEASIMGFPVFSTPMCPSWPINAGRLEDIDNPEYPDRYDWANSLAWSSWNRNEVDSIDLQRYQT